MGIVGKNDVTLEEQLEWLEELRSALNIYSPPLYVMTPKTDENKRLVSATIESLERLKGLEK